MSSTSATITTATATINDERYQVLVEFAYTHLDFQMAELESVLDMYGMVLDSPDCRMIPLPESSIVSTGGVTIDQDDNGNDNGMEISEQITNTEAETEAKAPPASAVANTDPTSDISNTANNNNNNKSNSKSNHTRRTFVILSFPGKYYQQLSKKQVTEEEKSSSSETTKSDIDEGEPKIQQQSQTQQAKQKYTMGIAEMISRCTLVRSVVELWGYASTIDECATMTKHWVQNTSIGKSIFNSVSSSSKSWKMTIHTLGAKFDRNEQDEMRKKYSYLGFDGEVKMVQPDNEFILIREIEMDGKGSPLYPRRVGKRIIPENDKRPPLAVYFGRVLSDGIRKGRNGIGQYDLKKRAYLGPTSMDSELSFVMTSFGQVRDGSIVFDPFVGTGSILLSCALRGAYCIGSDIDIRVLRGKSESETIWKNFEQYSLPRPEIIRTDNAIYHRHFRSNHRPIYDSIICDPPYGIRAGARKTGSRSDHPRPVLEENRHDHIAQTKPYPVCDVMSDLLDVAARTLVLHGRLVYIIPSFADFNPQTDLPRHDCLQLLHSCYQPLSLELGRRIIVMKKVRPYDVSMREKYLETIWLNGRESAEKCANLRDKILEAAKKKPGYEEKAAIRKQKRKATKEAKKRAKATKSASTSTSTTTTATED